MSSSIRILGIDPGSRFTGYGVIEGDGRHSRHIASGTIKAGEGEIGARLLRIFQGISEVIEAHAPQEVAVERVFLARNPDSALKLGQARGAAICAALARGMILAEYSAKEVKLAVVGGGGATKEQVQHMVKVLLNLDRMPGADAADALAVALCHAHSRTLVNLLAAQGGRRRK